MIGVATRAISVTLTIAAAPVIGTAQPGEPRPSPTFVHESWTVRDGLPVNSCLTNPEELVDGDRFTPLRVQIRQPRSRYPE